MSTSEPIILFDLPSQEPCRSWSLNPWKTRIYLNFKGLEYKTEWVEYPDIVLKFKETGLPPNDPNSSLFEYSIPVIRLPDGTYIMDSKAIATHLESLYPSPTVHLSSPYLAKLEPLMPQITLPLAPVFWPAVPRDLLSPRSAEYFTRTREKRAGMSLAELEKSDKGGDAAWGASRPHLQTAAAMLKENSDGPYFMGKEPSYADFVFAGFMQMFKRIGKMEKITEVDEVFADLYKACEKWLERDGH